MRVHVVALVTLLLLAALPAPASADVSVELSSTVTDVREETWKDQPTIDGVAGEEAPRTPVAQGVYRNPYFNASRSHRATIGHYLGATITLPSVSDDPASSDASKYVITAEIRRGGSAPLQAKLTKESPNTFYAEFDLDGDAVSDVDPLPPGVYTLVVEVFFVSTDPLHGADRVGISEFDVRNDPGRPASRFLSVFPTEHLRKWGDVGGLPHVPMTSQMPTSEEVPVGFNFPASANRTAEISAFVATRRTPQGPTGETGEVVVRKEVVFSKTTTRAGTIETTYRPEEILEAKQGDLLVLTGYLAGNGLDVGATMMVMPVSQASSEVSGYKPRTFGGPTGSRTDGFEVTVVDESGGARTADAFALTSGGQMITPARVVRSDPGGGDRFFANFAYQDIRRDRVSSYSIYTLLYASTAQDTHELHSLARARRGVTATIPFDVQLQRQQPGDVVASVGSSYTDDDPQRGEVGFAADVTVAARGLPGNESFTEQLTLEESETRDVSIPFPPSPPGTYVVQVNVSAAEVSSEQAVTVSIPDSVTDQLFTPGPGSLLATFAAAVAAWLWARRRGLK